MLVAAGKEGQMIVGVPSQGRKRDSCPVLRAMRHGSRASLVPRAANFPTQSVHGVAITFSCHDTSSHSPKLVYNILSPSSKASLLYTPTMYNPI